MPTKKPDHTLTTTSFALLGFLAERPMSAYELAKSMGTSGTRYLWPRTESRTYQEPQHLVASGLATVTVHKVGRRPRSVYTITDAGRSALADWLGVPGSSPRTEHEALLKVFLANNGSLAQLRDQLANIRGQIEFQYERLIEVLDGLSSKGHPSPQRAHLTRLIVHSVLADLEARSRWLIDAEARVSEWRRTTLTAAIADETNRWYLSAAAETRDALERFRYSAANP